jgi:hypothetical protein
MSMNIRFPATDEGAALDEKTREVCVDKSMFKAGVRLLFLPVIQDLLAYLGLAPSQVKTNGLRGVPHGQGVLVPISPYQLKKTKPGRSKLGTKLRTKPISSSRHQRGGPISKLTGLLSFTSPGTDCSLRKTKVGC